MHRSPKGARHTENYVRKNYSEPEDMEKSTKTIKKEEIYYDNYKRIYPKQAIEQACKP